MTDSIISPIEEIIEEARNGRMFILVDAEDRENEGDLIIPAQMATPNAINFMATYGRGLVCMPITEQRARQLNLDFMSSRNLSRHQTGFTVSIEAREGISTGISAHDRAHTIAVAADNNNDYRDIVTPGHVFPLVARDGGVLVRAGHTEAAVDISRLAGLNPSGVICEIMNEDGSMARLPDLATFAGKHTMKIGTIADLIAYRRRYDNMVRITEETTINSAYGGEFQLKVYSNTIEQCEHIALVKGDITTNEPVLTRMHACNELADVFAADGEEVSLIHKAMEAIGREGRGVVVLLRDGAEAAMARKVKAMKAEKSEEAAATRLVEYGIGAQILLDLGVHEVITLSNSPMPNVVALEGYNLKIVDQRAIG
jgi:3,4-dihydroxy 2-butanone 4-phosphate synthase/GTP cyclohydrolase II